ncbi:MAG: hypothetical protein DLM73_01040 [Chthoniobacterales bacterium]|nr:MAG: hypothetical protein DLM73_01040 [Chthoniobacterales bacterium]
MSAAGLARIYGTRTPLPDGRDSRTYLTHLAELESEAKGSEARCVGKGIIAASAVAQEHRKASSDG